MFSVEGAEVPGRGRWRGAVPVAAVYMFIGHDCVVWRGGAHCVSAEDVFGVSGGGEGIIELSGRQRAGGGRGSREHNTFL